MTQSVPPSSPLSSIVSSQRQQSVPSSQQSSQWRSIRELPFEIQQYVRIYFEEALFTRALDLLLSIVSSDVASQRGNVTVPKPEHLALAATLIVHPLVTTRTTSEEKWVEATAALRLLRLLLKTVGPVNAGFETAFKFRKLFISKEEDDPDAVIKHPFADEDSMWNRADDFWVVVGWAFNCSCLPDMYAARWKHWQLWLEFMIDVLETDWKYQSSQETPAKSMLWTYISQTPGDTAQPRRTFRAIFADGSKSSLNEFREVFRRELKGPKQEADKTKKREAVDIDNEVYGDYLGQDDSESATDDEMRTSKRASTRTASARRVTPRTSRQALHDEFEDDTSTSTATLGLGPPDSITLRLRLMQLLIHISSQMTLISSRKANFPNLADLFTFYVEFIKPLPLAVFQQLTSPSICESSTFSLPAHTTLLEFLLQRLLESSPSTVLAMTPLPQQRLETEYLPYAANKATLDANARVSLCVEALLRNLMKTGGLRKHSSLVSAVEKGVERRFARVREKKERMKEGSVEEEAWKRLCESAVRMRSVVRRVTE